MIRILYVITRMAVGGAPQHVLTVLRRLDRSRYRVALATGVPGPQEGSLMDAVRALDMDLHVVPGLRREIHPLHDMRAFRQLYGIIREGRYQIVHTHLSKAGILGRLAARCAGAPAVVHTFHGDALAEYSGLTKGVLREAERAAGLATDRFVSVSRELRARLAGYRIGRSCRCRLVYNGLCAEEFANVEPADSGEGPRVGTVAMFRPVKRLDLFLEVARRVRERRPEAVCEIAGGGEGEEALRRMAAAMGDPVRFLGIRYDRLQVLASFDLFVLCSDHEGMSVTAIEAMMLGLPVVATRVGGMPELVVDGETGLLAPRGDVEALAGAVLRLLDDAELRRRMGAAARARALERFSAKRMVNALDALYRELLQEAGNG